MKLKNYNGLSHDFNNDFAYIFSIMFIKYLLFYMCSELEQLDHSKNQLA